MTSLGRRHGSSGQSTPPKLAMSSHEHHPLDHSFRAIPAVTRARAGQGRHGRGREGIIITPRESQRLTASRSARSRARTSTTSRRTASASRTARAARCSSASRTTADAPPATVDSALLDRIRKCVGELTVNVQVVPGVKRHENGGEYTALTIPRATGVASTSDGRYFHRVGDTCRPIVRIPAMPIGRRNNRERLRAVHAVRARDS
jgi:hypothetical protein